MKIEGSDHLRQADYDPIRKELTVVFHNGKTYSYQNVPPAKWTEFENAGSKGTYLHTHIKPHHRVFKRK